MSTPTLQKQWVRAAVDLTQMYNDVEGKISKPKPTSLWHTLTWTTDQNKGDKSKKGKGKESSGTRCTVYPNLLAVVHILWKTQSKLEALQVFKLGTFPYIKY